jgi:hypothetical protein
LSHTSSPRGHFFFCGTRAWTQGLHLEPLHQPFFCDGCFKTGFCELFPWAGFKLWSSWSLSPELLGLQVWATGAWLGHFLTYLLWFFSSVLARWQDSWPSALRQERGECQNLFIGAESLKRAWPGTFGERANLL